KVVKKKVEKPKREPRKPMPKPPIARIIPEDDYPDSEEGGDVNERESKPQPVVREKKRYKKRYIKKGAIRSDSSTNQSENRPPKRDNNDVS
ncbi:MAG: hypothetical protein ACPG49_07305, partial [Chitinophagales bacterium]